MNKPLPMPPVVALIILLLPNFAMGGWLFGPHNSKDCNLKYQQEAGSKLAASAIHMACDKIFNKNVEEEYSQCILDHVGNTKSDLVVRAIVQSCSNIYIDNRDIKYSKCVLNNMPGVEIDMAARSIAASCRER